MTVRFFFYTLVLSWIGFALAASATNFGRFAFDLAICMPALVAIWLTGTTQGETGLQALFSRVFEWRVGLRWYIFAFGFILAIRLTAALIQRLATGSWPQFHFDWVVVLAGTILSIPVTAGEEVGWRGYALPRLGARFGYGAGSGILGAVWALWHLPLFFILPGSGNYHQSFPLFLAGVVPLSIAMGWLFVHTKGSVLLATLMHSAADNTQNVVHSGYAMIGPLSLNTTLIGWLAIALLWLAAIYFLLRMPRYGNVA